MKYKKLLFILSVLIFFGITAQAESNGYIIKFKTTPQNLDTTVFEEIHVETGVYAVENLSCLSGYESALEYVEENEEVELILPTDPMPEVNLMSMPDDNIYPEQWANHMVKSDYAWQYETYGNEVRVAVIDSGCSPHDELKNNLLPGKNVLNNTSDTTDDHGHGTHVSGIIAAEMNSSGIVGVAPKAKIVPIKCFSASQKPTRKQLITAIYSAVDDFNCRVINMSWGLTKDSTDLQEALDYAYNKGVILVSAVGNNGNDLSYPAASKHVIGVASVDADKNKSTFSRVNSSVFITAPGTRVLSTYNNNYYVYMNGTSQASPHIAGIAALALSAKPDMTPGEFETLLAVTSEDLGATGFDTTFGHGLANVQALMEKILENIPHYISPINSQIGASYVLIKNNTDDTLVAESIFAGYTGGRFSGLTPKTIQLLPGESTIVKTDIPDTLSHFLWTSLTGAEFLSDKR